MGLVIAVATIAGYGAAWWIVGMRTSGHGSALSDAFALVVFALLLGGAWRRMPDETPERRRERARRGNIIGRVTSLQVAVIVVGMYVLHRTGGTALLAPVVAVVMGLHFLAFARLFPAWMYYLTSAALVGVGVVGFLLRAGEPRVLTVSVGAACILWLTCVAVLIWPESRRSKA